MACTPPESRPGGPAHLTGRIARGVETHLIGNLYNRCHTLWAALWGSDCDFDDCLVALAERLGWQYPANADDDPEYGLNEILCETHDTICSSGMSWTEMRTLATEVFYAQRPEEAIELDRYDSRTWDEACDDAQFPSGQCELCLLGIDGTPEQHREFSGWVLHGRTTWEQVRAELDQITIDRLSEIQSR